MRTKRRMRVTAIGTVLLALGRWYTLPATPDPAARWKFALYWLGIKPGGNFVSWLMLQAIKRRAEAVETGEAVGAYSS